MSKIDELIQEYCPGGLEYRSLVSLCKIETGKLNANAAVDNGPYLFFTTAKEISRIDKYRWDTEALLIAGNANVGDVKHYEGKFDAYQRTYVLNSFDKSISVRFLYFFVSSALKSYLENRTNSAAMTYIVLSTLQDFKVPIPPLEVQKEIVNILDKFTQLEAELSAELDARRKQYEYYRNQLLTFDQSVNVKKLHQISEIYDSLHQTPKYSGEGWPMIRVTDIKGGYVDIDSALKVDRETFEVFTKKYKPQFNDIVVSRVGSYGNFSLIGDDGEVCLGQNTAIMHPLINAKYLYYVLHSSVVTKFIENNVGGGSQKTISLATIKEIPIHVPSPEEQTRIVDILDKFDSLTSSISEGLPAEINARRKQYEYYRAKLLAFQELSV